MHVCIIESINSLTPNEVYGCMCLVDCFNFNSLNFITYQSKQMLN